MRIDDRLLDALADRWPHIDPDWPGQDFEAWLETRMRFYNEFGFPQQRGFRLLWAADAAGVYDNLPPTLWHLVDRYPPAQFEDYVEVKASELRRIGGNFIQRVKDLRPLARFMLGVH